MKLTEKQVDFLSDFNRLYGLDLSNCVAPERSSRKAVTVMTAKLSETDISSLGRFCSSRNLQVEPNGYKTLAIFV